MVPLRLLGFLFFILASLMACKKDDSQPVSTEGFESLPLARELSPRLLDEASGIADSKANPGYLWVQQDSGNPNEIALLSHGGLLLKKIGIDAVINRDWEDIALASGPTAGINYLYLADIGDNNLASSDYFIYRFAEPGLSTGAISSVDKIIFQYPDGPHDAEAIVIDNSTKDIYIITKQDMPSRIYKLAYPQSISSVNTVTLSGSLSFSGVTGAAISPAGDEILVKTYTDIWQWKRNTGQSLEQALTGTPLPVAYQLEPQGEAICFKNDNTGFFTLSERPPVVTAINLNFYRRK